MRVIVARLVSGYPRDSTDRLLPYPVLARCKLPAFARATGRSRSRLPSRGCCGLTLEFSPGSDIRPGAGAFRGSLGDP